jgi:hypothetical protein
VAGLGDDFWTPLSGGRTNRLWRVGEIVVKQYDPGAATTLFPNDPEAEEAAMRHLAPTGLAPRLAGKGEGWIAYHHVAGDRWQSGPERVASALGRLHAMHFLGLRRAPTGSAALLAQARSIASECANTLPPPPLDPGIPPVADPVLIHGDAVPGNMIDGPAGLILIDWQCPALGDAAEDLATFLSPAMQWLYRGAVLDPGQAEAFLSAYPDPQVAERCLALLPVFRWRMAAHCLWKAERGAADYHHAATLELAPG